MLDRQVRSRHVHLAWCSYFRFMLPQPMPQRRHKAVTRIFFGGCHVELERRRREDRGAVGAEEGGV